MSENRINLTRSKTLSDSGILHEFYIDVDERCVKLRLNSKYNPPISLDVELDIFNKKGWTPFSNKFRDGLRPYKIDKDHENLIVSNVTDNSELIRSIARSNNKTVNGSQQQTQEQEQNNNQSDQSDEPKNTNEEKEKIIEKVSVSDAIRRNAGIYAVTGTIIGVSILSKTISKVSTYCEKCGIADEVIFNPIPVSNIRTIKENCKSCGKHIQFYNIKALDHKNTVIIELQDANSFDDLDRLAVFLFDRDTIGIKIGENVEVIGEIKILEKVFIYLPYLYGQSIQYLNRENYMLTKSDIDKIKEFKEKHGEDNVVSALAEIFDPSMVEHEFEKKGILKIAANTSDKIGDESEHIDALAIGPPGLAKSKILRRSTEIVPGSSRVGGQYATGKSITAIVEKTENSTILRLGSIPRSRNAICAINELAKLSGEDLDKLYDVMEERGFPYEKLGIKKFIPTPTSIIASANPSNTDTWLNNEKIDWNELPFLAPLKDRFDLIFIFQQKKDSKERDQFNEELAEVEIKRERNELPDYTEFLIKYIQYAKQFNPVITDEAWYLIKESYKKVNAKGFGSPRVLKTLKKLAKATARLKLKDTVDEKDVQDVMQDYNAMLEKFQKHVVISESIKTIAYKKGEEIIKKYENFGGISLEALFTTICKENKQLATYFGYDINKSLKIEDNHKVSDVKKLLLNNSHIKRIQDSPIVLKWFDEPPQSDESDRENSSDPEKTEKKHEKKSDFYESGQKPRSDTSDSDTITGFRMSPNPKGRIYEVSNERYQELKGEGTTDRN